MARVCFSPAKEEGTQIAVINYLRMAYPKAIVNSDLSGIRLTQGQAVKVKKLRTSNGFPDVVIYEPRRGYYGLFIELKRTGEKIYKKDGTLVADSHILEQAEMIEALKQRGYFATFAVGFNEAKNIIDWYFNERAYRAL